jgi:hypothetical protein
MSVGANYGKLQVIWSKAKKKIPKNSESRGLIMYDKTN